MSGEPPAKKARASRAKAPPASANAPDTTQAKCDALFGQSSASSSGSPLAYVPVLSMYPLVAIHAPVPPPLSDGDVAFPVRLVLPIVVSLDVYLGHLTFLHLCSRINAANLFSSAGVREPSEDVVDIASFLRKDSFYYQVTADMLSEFEQRADQSPERAATRQ